MKGKKGLCDCELDELCYEHLLAKQHHLIQLYERSVRSNKSKTLTLSYLGSLSNVCYNLEHFGECIAYGLKAEALFAKLNLNNDQRAGNAINVLQSYLELENFAALEKYHAHWNSLVAKEYAPYWILSGRVKEKILLHQGNIQGYIACLRAQTRYCQELKFIEHREIQLLYQEAQALYWLKCFVGASEVMNQLKTLAKDSLDVQHAAMDVLIQRALVNRNDIKEHPWNSHRICYQCWKVDVAYQKCSGCHAVYFCSPACQLLNWPSHKATCAKPSAQAKEAV